MLADAYQAGQHAAFAKFSMRREDRQRLAKEHGIVPGEGAWNWALRRSRQGATPQDLGMAPKSLIDKIWTATKGMGDKEVGAQWIKGEKPIIDIGAATAVDVGGHNRQFMSEVAKYPDIEGLKVGLQTVDPEARRVANSMMDRVYETAKGKNTIHSHPTGAIAGVMDHEKAGLATLRENNRIYNLPESQAQNRQFISDADATERLRYTNDQFRRVAETTEARHNSARPELRPSGYIPSESWGEMAQDGGVFKNHGVGTHHNIVADSGVGVHTLRPDKTHGGERLRSVLWDKPPQTNLRASLGLVGDAFKRRLRR